MGINKQFGILINNLRREQDFSQDKLSKLLNINRATLAKIEVGDTSPSLDLTYKILSFFKLKLSDLDIFIEQSSIESKLSKVLSNKSDLKIILNKVNEL